MIEYGRDDPDVDLWLAEDGVVRGGVQVDDRPRNGHPVAAEGPDLLAGLRTGVWLDAQRIPPLRYAVPGLVAEGMTLLVGPPKIGKSWLSLGLLLACASGGRALGQLDVTARPVLYLALEDGDRRLQDRCRALLGPGEPIPAGLQFLTAVRDGQVLATIAAWLDRHPRTGPLVVLDTLGRALPPARAGETTYGRDYRAAAAAKDVVDAHPGAALLVVHHTRKAGSEDYVDSVSGTHGLAGAADAVIVLARRRKSPSGTLAVTGRDVPEGEYAVVLDGIGSWRLDGDDLADAARSAEQARVTSGVGDRMAEVLAALAKATGPASPSELAERIDGVSADDVGKYLRRAAEAGRAEKIGRGRYAALTPLSEVSDCPNGDDDDPAGFGHTDTSDGGTDPDCGCDPECGDPECPYLPWTGDPS